MKLKNLLRTGLLSLALSAAPAVMAQAGLGVSGPLGCTVVPLSTNVAGPAPANTILAGANGANAGQTNTYPATYVVTNVYSNVFSIPVTYTTNVVTNTVTGYIDCSKSDDLVVQTGFSCTNTTDVSNVVFRLYPSLDATTCDTANPAFWITNTSPGSNTLVVSTVFSSAVKAGIAGFFVGAVINLNTNPIFAGITNSSGSNYQFMQYRGRKTVVY